MLSKIKAYWAAHKNKVTTDSLFSSRQITDYFAFEGHKDIDGWLSSESLTFVKALADFQNKNAIKGNVAEIGVYHGRFFVALCLMLNIGEKALAIDVFEDQEFNLDHSGKGDYLEFTENIKKKLGTLRHLEIVKSDSIKVNANTIHSILGTNNIRLFSVDGCHTAGHTLHDLQLASQVLSRDGVIILDDFHNEQWPGVEKGLMQFLDENEFFSPFAYGFNKLYLTTNAHIDNYKKYTEDISSRYSDALSFQDIGGNEVLNMTLPPPEHLFPDCFLNFYDFSSASNQVLLHEGWFPPEPWGVWSDGTQKALLFLPIPIKQTDDDLILRASFHAFVSNTFPEKKINIFMNSQQVDSVTFHYGMDYYNWQYQIQSGTMTDRSKIELSFEVDKPMSPKEIGLSEDTRKLGIGLRNCRFHLNRSPLLIERS